MIRLDILKVSFFLILGVLILGCEKEKENPPVEITGQLVSNTHCKDFLKSKEGTNITPDSLSCIEWTYKREDSILTLKHVNAGFNCCPEELTCEIFSRGDTIVIQETEKSSMCDCDCLYDLDIVINGVLDKTYKIKMLEPYARDEAELFFEIDLSTVDSGSYCVIRKLYPWGIHAP